MSLSSLFTVLATSFGLILIGGGMYEFLVVDPCWPRRPDLVQPNRGGISRKRFWIPAHSIFELMLAVSLILTWNATGVRFWLIVALASHAAMRIWSAVDFIPKALAFEKAETVDEAAARQWSRRSLLRFPLDLVTCVALFAAVLAVCQGS